MTLPAGMTEQELRAGMVNMLWTADPELPSLSELKEIERVVQYIIHGTIDAE